MSALPEGAALEVWSQRLAELAETMGATLRRAALSPNIKERRDYSAALFDRDGRLLAQAAHIPVHLGSMSLSVRAVIEAGLVGGSVAGPTVETRAVLLNDPFAGGTHLPDLTLVTPVDVQSEAGPVRVAWLAVRAHHADVGGVSAGSMPVGAYADEGRLPRSGDEPPAMGPRYVPYQPSPPEHVQFRPVFIDDEGLRIPPTLLDEGLVERVAAGARGGAERRGDLLAQQAALEAGRRALTSLVARAGLERFEQMGRALIAYADRLMRGAIAAIPDGVYAFADSLDDDGAGGGEVAIRLTLTIEGERASFDLSESDRQVPGPVNAVESVTLAAVLYALRLLLPDGAPTNEGLLGPVELLLAPGSVVCAEPPAAVSAGNVETSSRIVDVVLGALARALPRTIPAASAGTMSNLLFGGADWAYYETIPGGAGAAASGPGASAVQTHMTNTQNTPTEELERAVPVRVVRTALRRGSGGGGLHSGGEGVVRELELLAPAQVTLVADRRRRPPYGLEGGGPGLAGDDALTREGVTVRLPSKITFEGRPGDRIVVGTPGGGGHSDPIRARFWASILSGEPLDTLS